MSRTLNPQLFGPTAPEPANTVDVNAQVTYRKIREVEAQVDVIDQKIEKWIKILDGKIQQLHNAHKNLHEQLKFAVEGHATQYANLHSKINERKSADAKVHDMIDRHNQLVQTFETRLSQIQKVSSEQEMKLMAYQSTYDEVLREIRSLRLK